MAEVSNAVELVESKDETKTASASDVAVEIHDDANGPVAADTAATAQSEGGAAATGKAAAAANKGKDSDGGGAATGKAAAAANKGEDSDDGDEEGDTRSFWARWFTGDDGIARLQALFIVVLLAVVLPVSLYKPPRTVRRYYLAAEEHAWNYAPNAGSAGAGAGALPQDMCAAKAHAVNWPGSKFLAESWFAPAGAGTRNRVGTTYIKARYVAYTDATFTTHVPRDASGDWDHLGFLGPVLRAEVGDVVEVTFRNNARFAASVHPTGAEVSKANEGSHYNDDTPARWRRDDYLDPFGLTTFRCTGYDSASRTQQAACGRYNTYTVLPGETFTYAWDITEAAGPAEGSAAASRVWAYGSHARGDGAAGLNAGLVGPLIVTAKGRAKADGAPDDVDRELVVFMHVMDENASPYLEANVQAHIVQPSLDGSTLLPVHGVQPGKGFPGHHGGHHHGDGHAHRRSLHGGGPAGWVRTGTLDKAAVLQALYAHAAGAGAAPLTYADANSRVEKALAQRAGRVDAIHGAAIRVNFAQASFDPAAYDAANGGAGAARGVVEALVSTQFDRHGPGFEESNRMHHVNGLVFCHERDAGGKRGFTVKQGEKVRWHLVTLGAAEDVHTPHWHGNTVLRDGTRVDTFAMQPGQFESVEMVAENAGTWLFHCHVNDHINAGMLALYEVEPRAGSAGGAVSGGDTREYWIKAEAVQWDYVPGGGNACGGYQGKGVNDTTTPFTDPISVKTLASGTKNSVGARKVWKYRYVGYGADFKTETRQVRTGNDRHLGILGPVLRAAVGDQIVVHFRNDARNAHALSMHPHGVAYAKGSEGAAYAGGPFAGDAVAPGAEHTYTWNVTEAAGPGPNDGSSVAWLYHSHVREANDTNAGLVGPMIVYERGTTRAAQEEASEREGILLFTAFDESHSTLTGKNLNETVTEVTSQAGTLRRADADAGAWARAVDVLSRGYHFKKYSKRHSINGMSGCTLPRPVWSAAGKKPVRWYLMALGSEGDVHTPHWVGHSVVYRKRTTAALGLMPASVQVADMAVHDRGGVFPVVDQASGHFRGGARAEFGMRRSAEAALFPWTPDSGRGTSEPAREYWIAADEVEWDYAPEGRNMCSGAPFGDAGENTYVKAGAHHAGSKYVKALFRSYKDASFERLKYGPASRFNPASKHLGLLGPVLRAEVGDVLKITFRNNLRAPANLVPLGGPLAATTAGYPYGSLKTADGAVWDGGAVAPGKQVELWITVGEDAGPGPNDPSSIAWAYASQVDPRRDVHSGLLGVILVTRKGEAKPDGVPKDVQREFVTVYNMFDERESRYRDLNVAKYALSGVANPNSAEFKASNKMHSINGFLYCNLPGLKVVQNNKVRWYTLGLGDSSQFHTPRVSGAVYRGSQGDAPKGVGAPTLTPGQSKTVDLVADYAGIWRLGDTNNANAEKGMTALFKVDQVLAGKE